VLTGEQLPWLREESTTKFLSAFPVRTMAKS